MEALLCTVRKPRHIASFTRSNGESIRHNSVHSAPIPPTIPRKPLLAPGDKCGTPRAHPCYHILAKGTPSTFEVQKQITLHRITLLSRILQIPTMITAQAVQHCWVTLHLRILLERWLTTGSLLRYRLSMCHLEMRWINVDLLMMLMRIRRMCSLTLNAICEWFFVTWTLGFIADTINLFAGWYNFTMLWYWFTLVVNFFDICCLISVSASLWQ